MHFLLAIDGPVWYGTPVRQRCGADNGKTDGGFVLDVAICRGVTSREQQLQYTRNGMRPAIKTQTTEQNGRPKTISGLHKPGWLCKWSYRGCVVIAVHYTKLM